MSQKLLGNLDQGIAFVLSAPAGTGKNTLLYRLMDEYDCVQESVSCTTRPKRPGEIDGVHYNFLSREDFENKIVAREFLEYAQVFGKHYYGTLREEVLRKTRQGKHVFMVIDVKGAQQVRERFPQAVFVFISPPSLEEARRRLEGRHTEPSEVIDKRIKEAFHEMKFVVDYDYNILNDDLEVAYQVFKSVVVAEEYKIRNYHN
ncbi:MAG: guanylate kinase [Chlamydiota bacterium]